MDTQTVQVGTITALSSGITQDDLRDVEFKGEFVADRTVYGYDDRRGKPTDTRGTTQALYRLESGSYVVHTRYWSHWQGEEDSSTLERATAKDLQFDGPFEALGRAAGMGRPLTLAEALATDDRLDEHPGA